MDSGFGVNAGIEVQTLGYRNTGAAEEGTGLGVQGLGVMS